jgi:IPT/TIG domain/Glycosyl hydrolases family 39
MASHRRHFYSKAAVSVLAVVLAFATLTAFSPAAPASRQAASGNTLSNRYGVCDPHLPFDDDSTMELKFSGMNAAGISSVRCVFAWPDMEPSKGAWNFARTDLVMQKAAAHEVKVLVVLGFTPSWANGGKDFNCPPTDTAAWRNYVTTVCTRYAGRVSAWEIWNEENIDQFWQPKPDAAAYVALLSQTSPLIKTADPGATIVMGGVAGLDPAYLDGCLKAGAADLVDAIAYHPYPETLRADDYTPQESRCRDIVTWVRGLISSYTAKPLGIWITELGWTTCTESPPGVSVDTQASYMLRTMLNYAGTGVDRVFYYSLYDEQINKWDNYGLATHDYSPKLSFNYFRTLQSVFGQAVSPNTTAATFTCATPATLEAHAFNLADGSLAVGAWKSNDVPDTLGVTTAGPAYARPVTVDPASGLEQQAPNAARAADGSVTSSGIAVGKRPVIIRFAPAVPRVTSIAPASAAAGSTLTVTGEYFGPARGASSVSFGSLPAASYASWSDTTIKCQVPSGLTGTVPLKVTTPYGTSNGADFTVFRVASIGPNQVVQSAASLSATVQGSGFKAGATVRLHNSVRNIDSTSATVASGAVINCVFGSFVGAETGAYDVIVINGDGQQEKLAAGLTVTAPCGGGAGTATAALGLVMGVLAAFGAGPLKKRLKKK